MTNCLVLLLMAMSTGEERLPLPLKGAVIHRPAHATDQKAFEALPGVALLAEKPRESLSKLAAQITAAGAKVSAVDSLYLLAAGPVLDGPDRVEVHSLTKHDREIVLELYHTSARLSGKTMRRNIQWRPVAQVPIQLSPGKWKVIVDWVPYSDLPKGKALAKPKSVVAEFEVQAKPPR